MNFVVVVTIYKFRIKLPVDFTLIIYLPMVPLFRISYFMHANIIILIMRFEAQTF